MIQLTKDAINHLEHICKTQNCDFIRLEITGGGCSGFQYKWDMIAEGAVDQTDEIFNDILVVDDMSQIYLFGSEIDYNQEVWGAKLEIRNPNAMNACGCGESVSF